MKQDEVGYQENDMYSIHKENRNAVCYSIFKVNTKTLLNGIGKLI